MFGTFVLAESYQAVTNRSNARLTQARTGGPDGPPVLWVCAWKVGYFAVRRVVVVRARVVPPAAVRVVRRAGFAGATASAATAVWALFNCSIRRLLRRAAWFLWMMPLLAAWSSFFAA